jgi:hypothetical protein
MGISEISEALSEAELDYQPENTCFVVFPTGEENAEARERANAVFQNIVEPAAAGCGLRCIRSEWISPSGIITRRVVSHLTNDRIVLADLSDRDPTVFYGLALRHALRKRVVQLIAFDQKSLLSVEDAQTVNYELKNAECIQAATEATRQHIAAAMSPARDADSSVATSAENEELSRSYSPQIQAMFRAILDKVTSLDKSVVKLMSGDLMCRPEVLKELISDSIEVRTDNVLKKFTEQIDLLKSVQEAGVIAVERGRERALRAFAHALDEEYAEIMVVGSSLKGLLQKGEYGEIAEKLRSKIAQGVRTRFLLTHPVVADLRGSQESRAPTEMGVEIVASLKILRFWHVNPACIRMYIGPPTCFAITTSRRMVINPYAYLGASYDSPCLILDCSGYLFEHFRALHFGAWDTKLAIPIRDFEETIRHYESMLGAYASDVGSLVAKGRSLAPAGAAGR